MKIIAYNQKQLDVAFGDMCNVLGNNGALSLEYSVPAKPKTKKQLGFFFAALADNVQIFFKSKGENYTIETIKNNFYFSVSQLFPDLLLKNKNFNGESYTMPLTLSQMTVEQASLFIEGCLILIDNSSMFAGLILHPSIRYTWVNNVTQEDIHQMSGVNLPRQSPEYLASVRKEPCIWCGKANCSEVHHLKEAGFTGTGYKADDWLCVPLCPSCHTGSLHQNGSAEFLKSMEWITKHISLADFCAMKYLKWLNKK